MNVFIELEFIIFNLLLIIIKRLIICNRFYFYSPVLNLTLGILHKKDYVKVFVRGNDYSV